MTRLVTVTGIHESDSTTIEHLSLRLHTGASVLPVCNGSIVELSVLFATFNSLALNLTTVSLLLLSRFTRTVLPGVNVIHCPPQDLVSCRLAVQYAGSVSFLSGT